MEGRHAEERARRGEAEVEPTSPSGEPLEIVRDTLLEYAERGVFRGFEHGRVSGPRRDDGEADEGKAVEEGEDEDMAWSFHFFWLGPHPFRIDLSSDGRSLTVRNPFPGLGQHPTVRAEVEEMIDERLAAETESLGGTARASQSSLPPHRRIDTEKISVELVPPSGPGGKDSFDLVLTIRGGHQEYAVRKVLNLIHEIWVRLQDRHQRYMWEEFQASME